MVAQAMAKTQQKEWIDRCKRHSWKNFVAWHKSNNLVLQASLKNMADHEARQPYAPKKEDRGFGPKHQKFEDAQPQGVPSRIKKVMDTVAAHDWRHVLSQATRAGMRLPGAGKRLPNFRSLPFMSGFR